MKRVLFYARLIWRPLLVTLALIGGSAYLLTYRIASLVPGYSSQEIGYFSSLTQSPIFPINPVYLPIHLIHKAVLSIIEVDINLLRIVNSLIGLLSVVLLYFVIRNWYTTRVALMVSAMTLTSSWFLLNTRVASPDIYTNMLLLLIISTIWLQITKKRKLSVLTAAASIGLAMYIPGALWLILIAVIWKRKYIINEARSVPFWYALSSLLLIFVLMIPALINGSNTSFLADISGLTGNMITPKAFALNLYYFFGSLFWNSSLYTANSIGRQGLLDVFTIAMLIAGIIAGLRMRDRARFKLLFGWLAVGLLLIGIGGSVSSLYILAPVMILVSQGIAWILQQWFTVFPKNPVARKIGVVLVSGTVALSVTYNLYRYFVAWPSMDTTKSSYNLSS